MIFRTPKHATAFPNAEAVHGFRLQADKPLGAGRPPDAIPDAVPADTPGAVPDTIPDTGRISLSGMLNEASQANRFVGNWHTCRRTKATYHAPTGHCARYRIPPLCHLSLLTLAITPATTSNWPSVRRVLVKSLKTSTTNHTALFGP
jgi:hypothetical protein